MSASVALRVPASLRSLVGDAATINVPVDDGEVTVGAVLGRLAVDQVALYRRICDERGQVRTHVNVFVGSDNVRDLDGLDTPVPAGAEVSVLPAVSGGLW